MIFIHTNYIEFDEKFKTWNTKEISLDKSLHCTHKKDLNLRPVKVPYKLCIDFY